MSLSNSATETTLRQTKTDQGKTRQIKAN